MRIVGPLSFCSRGGIGRRVRLRTVWGNPWRFESSREQSHFLSRWRLVNQLLLQQKAKPTGTARQQFESTDLLTRTFSSCRPSSFHQLGKPLSPSRSNSAFLHGRCCSCSGLYPCPTSSGGSRKFGASRSRHRAAAPSGSCRARAGTSQD
jgi:hypothetical protein